MPCKLKGKYWLSNMWQCIDKDLIISIPKPWRELSDLISVCWCARNKLPFHACLFVFNLPVTMLFSIPGKNQSVQINCFMQIIELLLSFVVIQQGIFSIVLLVAACFPPSFLDGFSIVSDSEKCIPHNMIQFLWGPVELDLLE